MRITFRSLHDGVNAVSQAADQFIRSQQQVETGKRLLAPSDDPAAMMRVIEGKTDIAQVDSYTRSGDTAGSRLAYMDTILSDVVDKLTAAKVTAASARGTTADANARATIAASMQGLRDGLLSDFNSTFRGSALFSGTEGQTQGYAMVAGAWSYQGDATDVTVDVADGRSVTVALNGEAIAKGSDAADMFTEMDALIVAIQAADEAGMTAGMAALDRAFDRAIRTQSRVGVDEKSITDERARLTDLRLASLKRVGDDENADMAQAITEMTQAQTAYQAALQAVGAASRVSLLDYLS